jgi:hypothetical protein
MTMTTIVTTLLLGVGLYFLAVLPVAVLVGRLLAGPAAAYPAEAAVLAGEARPADVAGPAGAEGPQRHGLAVADVAAGRPLALVAGQPSAGGYLQLARTEAHPAHS